MDLTQIFIIISLTVVSVSIAVCTYYIVGLIKELKTTVASANTIVSSVAKPVSSFSEFLMGFKNGFKLFNTFFDKDRK